MNRSALARRVLAEFVGTAFLLVAVVGSGIAAQRLSPDNSGLQLLENAIATGAALVAIILAVGSVSGAHLNPVVSCIDASLRGLRRVELAGYVIAQAAGAVVGVVVANLMFALPPVVVSTTARDGLGLLLGEVVATLGLCLVVFGISRAGRAHAAPFAVGAYITGAYFFTSSTSFANPAVTVARTLSDTFAGIAPASVAPFIGAQCVGAALAYMAIRALWPYADDNSRAVVLPHAAPDGTTPEGEAGAGRQTVGG